MAVERGIVKTLEMSLEPQIRSFEGMPLGSRIRAARELRGWTQGETVAEMPRRITTAALSQIEAEKYRPTNDTLVDLAASLGVPTEYFFKQWPSDLASSDEPATYFRDLRATSVRERRQAFAVSTLLVELVAAIEHHVRLPDIDVPRIDMPPGIRRAEIEDAASEVRRRWQLGVEPLVHVIRELERRGIPVARLSMGHKRVDAFSIDLAHRPIVLLSDDKQNYVRSRFDAAHELGHLVMHRGRTERERSAEQQAHSFAASFLFPRGPALEELPPTLDTKGWNRLAQLKSRWGMSIAALLRRAVDLGIHTENDYRNAMRFMSSRGWRQHEPGDRELGPPESPLLIQRALRSIEVREGTSPEELIESLGLPVADTLELVRATLDQRPTIEF